MELNSQLTIIPYLHLYLGCEVVINPDQENYRRGTFIGFVDEHKLSARIKFRAGPEGHVNILFLKPILRHLSDMSEEEREESKNYVPLGVKHDLFLFKDIINATQFINWLRKKEFDIDGLIEAGLAIDKTKIYGT